MYKATPQNRKNATDSFGDKQILSVGEYRKILNDYSSTDDRIKERIEYLTTFSRKIIRREVEKYVEGKK